MFYSFDVSMWSRFLVIFSLLVLLLSSSTALYATEAFEPDSSAVESDLVVYGNVSSVSSFGLIDDYHPVQISVEDFFKGNASDTVTVRVRGDEGTQVSNAADFSVGETVVVMMQEIDGRYYMTHGYATKYEVENGSITYQPNETLTVQEMEQTVENATRVNGTQQDISRNPERKNMFELLLASILNTVFSFP
jgi:hypothetical protein